MPEFGHISEDDLERLIVGAVKDEEELATLEEHLLTCGSCIHRAEGAEKYIEVMHTALKRIQARAKKAKREKAEGSVA